MTAVDTRIGPRSAHSFVGRVEQRKALDQMIRESARGAVRVAVIEGDAGIGKTHLLQVTVEQAQVLGVRTFIGRSEEMTAGRPFGSIRDALDTRRADGARARPNELLRRPDQQGLTFAIADALVDVVEEDVAEGPVLIALEDAHWADSGTLVAIRAISKLEALPLALVITTRSRPRRSELASLLVALAKDGATWVDLQGLSPEECDALARSVLGGDGVDSLPDLLARTGGNPLFLLEVVRGALPGAEEAQLADPALPAGLKKVLLESVASLDGPGVEALQVASVLGDAFDPTELAAVMDTSIVELLPRLTDAVARGLLVEDGGGLRFRHSLIRDAIYSELPAGIARALHRTAATGLGASGASPLRVAEHLIRSADRGDQEALDWLDQAVDATPDSAAAAALLKKRIELSDENDEELPGARLWLVRTLRAAGQMEEALALGEQLLAEGPVDVLYDLRVTLSYLNFDRGLIERAGELLDAALAMDEISTLQRARAMGWQVELFVYLKPDEAIARGEEALALVAGEPEEVWALVALCSPLFRAGRLEEAVATGERAVAMARTSLVMQQVVSACHITGWAYLNSRRNDEARAMFHEALAAADACGNVTYISRGHESLGQLAFRLGEWDEALVHWETADRNREQFTLPAWPDTSMYRSYVLGHRGDIRAARACLMAGRSAKEGFRPFQLTLEWVGALITGLGDIHRGAAEAAEVWHRMADEGALRLVRFLPEAVCMFRDAGREDLVAEIAEVVDAKLAKVRAATGGRLPRPDYAGALASDDPERLVAASQEARAEWPDVGRAWLYATAAVEEIGRGNRPEASALFADALADLEHLGTVQAARAVRARMRSCGLRPGSKGVRRRAASGWESLTAQEKEVVKLAADGFTNPQIGEQLFISKRTVGTHLANVFRKLGVSSRSALRDYREP